jgi:cytoskeletal protein CcmA (bactofilin family)
MWKIGGRVSERATKLGRGGNLNGFLDGGSHLEGKLHFEDTFRVDGRFTGEVESKGDLVVGQGGQIEGTVRVGRVFVSGTVQGDLYALRLVEIGAKGRVIGNLHTPALIVEDGGQIEGRCVMEGITSVAEERSNKP